MKISFYNHFIENGTNRILYNSHTDEVLLMSAEVSSFYEQNKENPDRIKYIYTDFFQYLVEKGFLVDNNTNEQEEVVLNWKKKEDSTQTFTVIVNPTLDCNMRCWYCYEKHLQKSKMDDQTISSVIRLIQKKCHESLYEDFVLSFFGGEPFLYFDSVVMPLIENVSEICNKSKKKLQIHFTTNAYLLNEDVLSYLQKQNVSFQVTLDGNEKIHNRTRFTEDRQETYKTIVSNIKKALSNGHQVSVRLNYMAKKTFVFLDIIADFYDVTGTDREKLIFDFHRIWQDNISIENIEKEVSNIELKFRQAGFKITASASNKFGHCYADSEHSLVVNYDGKIFKCTARDFTDENCEGEIEKTGDIAWNKRHFQRKTCKYSTEICSTCKIFPLCHGGCSQDKLEGGDVTACIKKYTEQEKYEIVLSRIKDLLALNIEKTNLDV